MDKKKIEEAIKKINEEISKAKDPYVKIVGEYVLKHIELNGQAVEGIASGDKTITKSIDKVKSVAKTKAVNGCAMMTDEEVFKIVREYLKFDAVQDKIIQVEVEEIKEEFEIKEVKQHGKLDMKLEDFLN